MRAADCSLLQEQVTVHPLPSLDLFHGRWFKSWLLAESRAGISHHHTSRPTGPLGVICRTRVNGRMIIATEGITFGLFPPTNPILHNATEMQVRGVRRGGFDRNGRICIFTLALAHKSMPSSHWEYTRALICHSYLARAFHNKIRMAVSGSVCNSVLYMQDPQ